MIFKKGFMRNIIYFCTTILMLLCVISGIVVHDYFIEAKADNDTQNTSQEVKDITEFYLADAPGDLALNCMVNGESCTIGSTPREYRMYTTVTRNTWDLNYYTGGMEFLVDFSENGLPEYAGKITKDAPAIEWSINAQGIRIYRDKVVHCRCWNDSDWSVYASTDIDKIYTGVQYVKIVFYYTYTSENIKSNWTSFVVSLTIGEDIYTFTSSHIEYNANNIETKFVNRTGRDLTINTAMYYKDLKTRFVGLNESDYTATEWAEIKSIEDTFESATASMLLSRTKYLTILEKLNKIVNGADPLAPSEDSIVSETTTETKDITEYNLGKAGNSAVNDEWDSITDGSVYTILASDVGQYRAFTDTSRSSWDLTIVSGGVEFLVDFGINGLPEYTGNITKDTPAIEWGINAQGFRIYRDKVVACRTWQDEYWNVYGTMTFNEIYTGVQYVKIESQFQYLGSTFGTSKITKRLVTITIGEDVYSFESTNKECFPDQVETKFVNRTGRDLRISTAKYYKQLLPILSVDLAKYDKEDMERINSIWEQATALVQTFNLTENSISRVLEPFYTILTTEQKAELEETKTAAISDIEGYVSIDNYYSQQVVEVSELIVSAKIAISVAVNKNSIEALLKEYKGRLAAVYTKGDIDRINADIQKWQTALDSYLTDYRQADYPENLWQKILLKQTDAKAEIAQKSLDIEMELVYNEATLEISHLLLSAEKEANKNVLVSYVDLIDYNEKNQEIVKDYILQYQALIDNAVSKTEVEAVVAEFKAMVDALENAHSSESQEPANTNSGCMSMISGEMLLIESLLLTITVFISRRKR